MLTRPLTQPLTGPLVRGVGEALSAFSPLSLPGLQAWFDPYAADSLYQDNLGATPVTAQTQFVGRISDKSGKAAHAVQATGSLKPRFSSVKNLKKDTQTLSAATWAKDGVTVIANAALAPDGTTTADLLLPSTSSALHRISQGIAGSVVIGSDFTFSAYAKAAGYRYLYLNGAASAGQGQACFDLQTGTVTAQAQGAVALSITPASGGGGGWYRIAVTGRAAGTSNQCFLCVNSTGAASDSTFVGDGTSGILVWGPQLEWGDQATSYQRVTAADTSYDAAASSLRMLAFDGIDDTLTATFGASLGAACTVVRGVRGQGTSILTAQTIGTTYAINTSFAGLMVFDRALTAQETSLVTAWMDSRSKAGAVQINSLAAWGDSLTSGTGGTPYPTALGIEIGRAQYNGGVGGETSTQIKTRVLADTLGRNGWVNFFWMGRNNFTDGVTVKADIAACVSNLAGNGRYLVLSILASATDTAPDIATLTQLNTDLSALYGSHYLDVRAYLQAHGDGSTQDNADIAAGYTPTSLRASADPLHLNATGYQLVADCVAAKLNSLGW